MAINFGDGSVQDFSSKIIQVKRALRATEITTTSSTMSDVTSIDFTPKSASSRIHCEFTGCAYQSEEAGGLRGRFYDTTDSNRFGTSLSGDDPLLFRFDMQQLSDGAIYAYAGIIWRADEASWGAGTSKNIKFQISNSGNGSSGFISSFLPATFTIMEVIES
tara:strand:+ start:583 stop:1068 length:486 start_codon:yes stop_codon:yes gene_type:complete